MEYQNIINLLDTTFDNVPRFITKNWIEVYDQSGTAENSYKPSKQIRFKTSMLRSDLCDYSDAYIVVKGDITVLRGNNDAYEKKSAFKNNAPFISCISKIYNTLIDNAEDLDVLMPMYNLIEYSKNSRKTTGTLWNYYRDEPNSGAEGGVDYYIKNSKSFDYKTSITGKLGDNNKDFNVSIDGKSFFEIPVKNKEEAYKAIIETNKNNDYTIGKLLDNEYLKDHSRLIAIDLCKQIEL